MNNVFHPARAAIALCVVAALGVSQTHAATARQWREDLDFVVKAVKARHPMWNARVDAADFDAAAEALRKRVPELSDTERVVEFMRLASMIAESRSRSRTRHG